MKRTKIIYALSSFILSGLSIAATKPMRTVNQAYILNPSPSSENFSCITVETPCIEGNVRACTTIIQGGLPQHVDKVYKDSECQVIFLEDWL